MSETKEPWEVEQIQEKNRTKENKVENTPLETRDKEHCETLRLKGRYILKTRRLRKGTKEDQIRTALRLKSDTSLDKMKRTWAEDTTLWLNG